ncbi:MAG: signal peptidase I [Candidatus Omnitrophica bacterium]|nr:signal peptidase I [Candidatus Omnitrophota bacterium]
MTKSHKEEFDVKVKSQLREWAESILVALAIAIFIQTFILQAFKIPSGSMIPTFQVGDRIFVNKFLYSARVPFVNWRFPILDIKQPKRGDIIVFVSPEDPKKDFVKRLIAFGGEKVEIREGRILVNGHAIQDPVIKGNFYNNAGDYGAENKVVVVPPDSYFTLGDNSVNSRDSRYWGYVPKKNLIGKAMVIYWPLNRIRVVK